jgi:hypothetical protein
MKSFLIFVVGAIIGAVAAIVFAGGIFAGLGAGAGLVTGLKAGSCLTAEAAKEKGYVTADQVGELLSAAGMQMTAQELADNSPFADGAADCQKIINDLKTAAAKSR